MTAMKADLLLQESSDANGNSVFTIAVMCIEDWLTLQKWSKGTNMQILCVIVASNASLNQQACHQLLSLLLAFFAQLLAQKLAPFA